MALKDFQSLMFQHNIFIKIAKLSTIMIADNVFTVIDKTGREIRLTRRQFQHVICHKGMENHIEEIKDTLVNPLKIVSHEAGNLYDYYTYHKNRKQKAKYLQVVVKYLNGHGFVLTTYFVRHM